MTTTQIKIDALRAEIEKRMADIEDYRSRIERAMQEMVRYQSGTEIRKNEVAQLEKDLETMKESIPDFNQETCEKYLKYYEMKTDYERLAKDYHEIDNRIARSEKDINLYEGCVKEAKMRIEYLKSELNKSQSERGK